MLPIIPKLKPFLKSCVLISGLMLLYACDTLEHDMNPGGPDVVIVGKEVVVLSNGAAYIDMYSRIKTNSTVKLNIASLPSKGELSELGIGFLRYSPSARFFKGRDAFAFSAYDENNRLLTSDSLVIIVEDDTTNLPCGIYPQDDYVYQTTAAPVSVNVVANDILCGDSSNLILEVYRPNNSFPPYAGTASVVSNSTIQYTPGSNFSGSDKVIYKLSSPADSSLVGFAVVHISAAASCDFIVKEDTLVFDADSLLVGPDSVVSDSLRFYPLHVLNNDVLCDSADYTFTITQFPEHGNAFYDTEAPMVYAFPRGTIPVGFTDHLMYRVCIDQRCRYGHVIIRVE